MPIRDEPTDAVRLPPPMDRALALLIARAAGLKTDEAEALKTALFGNGPPTFGQVRRISAADLASAADKACPKTAVVALKELAELMPRIDPRTPVCDRCDESPLSNVGGKIFALDVGAVCPFCPKGRLELVPMKLRMVAWTDGHLTEPQTTHDLRILPGCELPLQDEGILHWADGWIEPALERALRDAGTSVYAFLAYMRLGRKTLARIEDAADMLHDPKRLGLADARSFAEAAKAAKAFVEAREVTNIPAKPFLIERLGGRNLPRLTVAGRTYLLEGRIGRGDKTDVFRALWDHQPTERVVLKISRTLDDADLMKNEVRVLKAIQASEDPGAYFFTRILPEYVADGTTVGSDGLERRVTVLRDRNLFDWTLEDVIEEYPEGVEPQSMVWMWNRVLTLLAWTHRIGYVHGAIVPSHVLLHVQNHAVTLLDWAAAVRYKSGKERIAIVSDGYEAYYPKALLSKEAASPEMDLAMSARCMIGILGGSPKDGRLPASVPTPIADFLRLHGMYGKPSEWTRAKDALELQKAFGKIAESVYGPRAFHPFLMPRKRK
ncbi:MAG: hypothetical protein AAB554_02165 [Patescibacteria group bacterium]